MGLVGASGPLGGVSVGGEGAWVKDVWGVKDFGFGV